MLLSLCVCMRECMCVCMCICVSACACVHMCDCMYVCVCISACVCNDRTQYCYYLFRCCVVDVKGRRLDLSSRASRTEEGEGEEAGSQVRDPEICDLGGLTQGKLVRGYVKSVTDFGVYVR